MPDNAKLKAAQAWQAANQAKIQQDNQQALASRTSDAVDRSANKYKWTGPQKKAVGDYMNKGN